MNVTIAGLTLESLTPYSQSRKHDEPKLEGESADEYNHRTWKSQALIENGTVHIAASGFHQCLVAAARYSKKQIAGQGKATWTKKFEAGITLFQNIDLGIPENKIDHWVDIYANADGIRGSGKRVMRRFPMFPQWRAQFDVHILDPIITADIFEEITEIAGMFIGLGRYRPENGGTNGRFRLAALEWNDKRQLIDRKAA